MGIDLNLVNRLLAQHGERQQNIASEKGWLKQLTKTILERALNAELSDHLGYAKHGPNGYKSGNSQRITKKTLKGDFGEIDLETPARPQCGVVAADCGQESELLGGF